MTYAQIMARIAELDCGDNYKLVGYLLEHGVVVLSCTSDRITVNTWFSKDGKGFYEQETIAASMPAVRDYLGY